jgi:hypothetical protein
MEDGPARPRARRALLFTRYAGDKRADQSEKAFVGVSTISAAAAAHACSLSRRVQLAFAFHVRVKVDTKNIDFVGPVSPGPGWPKSGEAPAGQKELETPDFIGEYEPGTENEFGTKDDGLTWEAQVNGSRTYEIVTLVHTAC